jgi:hypothetical protein
LSLLTKVLVLAGSVPVVPGNVGEVVLPVTNVSPTPSTATA